MARKATNKLLQTAKKSKNDEFYTQYCDIEKELQHYQGHFCGKTVYCNCDDPRISNFFKYFATNFHKLGLRKLIATCYQESDNDLFSTAPQKKGLCCELNGDCTDLNELPVRELNGNGDFRSAECIELLKQCDIVVTNPPFSLFREFVSTIVKHGKQFLIIGNINAITYKEIFSLIQRNQAWLGINLGRGISGFIVPEHYELYGTETSINEEGQMIVSTNNCLWLTNMETSQRHTDLPLTKKYYGNESQYPAYDNCKGININKTQDIPLDYHGLMGVPITFLHKYNPEQFEIVRFRKGDDNRDLSVNGSCPYFRILIKNRKALPLTQ